MFNEIKHASNQAPSAKNKLQELQFCLVAIGLIEWVEYSQPSHLFKQRRSDELTQNINTRFLKGRNKRKKEILVKEFKLQNWPIS